MQSLANEVGTNHLKNLLKIEAREKVDRVKPEWRGNYKLMWVDKEGDQVSSF